MNDRNSISKGLRRGILAAILSAGMAHAEAGIIDILRGEKETPAPSYQRVAFVGSAVIKEVAGQAERMEAPDQWSALRAGVELREGEVIRTLEGCTVILQMRASGSLVRMTPLTIMRLVPMQKEWDKSILTGTPEGTGYSVRAVRGRAEFRTSEGRWAPLEVNAAIANGTQIRTAPGSCVDLFKRADGYFLRLAGDTTLRLEEEQPIVRFGSGKAIAAMDTSETR